MSTFTLRRATLAVAIAAAALTPAWAAKLSMEAATTNSVVGLLPQSMAPIWAKAGLDVQLALDQTLTKSLIKMAQGSLDSSVVPPSAYADMKGGKGFYKSMGDKGAEAAGHVRALWAFSASNYHPIVWADSGITDWSKIKGKRVYIGPPAGAANAQVLAIIKQGSGLTEADFSAVKAPWGVAPQGFHDGQYDVLVLPATLGSSVVTEMSLNKPIRILSLPANSVPPDGLGMIKSSVPKGTYSKGQVNSNEDITTWQTYMMMMVNKNMTDDVAYKLTKTYIESRKDLAKGNAMLKDLATDDPLSGVNAPLHPGAAKYYKEAGFNVPAELIAK